MAESYYLRQHGSGGTFTFTPSEPGKYPIHVSVKDSVGIKTDKTVMVTVTGALPQPDPVRLELDDDSGRQITLDEDGLQAHYAYSQKGAVRANQGIYGDFWYFETHRLIDPAENIGCGLVVSKGSLDPLNFFSTQPSLQVNFLGTAWIDLIFQASAASASGYYGFAVDYRSDHPTVYVIVENVVIRTFTLDHVWVPLYPILYGNPTTSDEPFDNEINFGATAFHNNPVAALTTAGVDTTDFEVGWGGANTP